MTDMHMPTDSVERKGIPLAEGVLFYFPAALAEVAKLSKAGNEKHSPGQPLHHARGKSADHADCIIRHLIDSGTIDPEDGIRHSAKVAWRALALLQEELERAGAPLARNAKLPEEPKKDTPIAEDRGYAALGDGWLEHQGYMPVARGTPIRVRYRDGMEEDCCAGDTSSNDWHWRSRPVDIMAWKKRTISEDKKSDSTVDGWFANKGHRPVALGEAIRVKYACGLEVDCLAGDESSFSWQYLGQPYDIVAWRPQAG